MTNIYKTYLISSVDDNVEFIELTVGKGWDIQRHYIQQQIVELWNGE